MGRLSPFRISLGLAVVFLFFITPNNAAPVQESAISQSGSNKGCYFHDKHYPSGQTIDTNDKCLNCTCAGNALMCYLRVCPFVKPLHESCKVEKHEDDCCPKYYCLEAYPRVTTVKPDEETRGCYVNGLYLDEGARIPMDPLKPCEACYCIRNTSVCTLQTCKLDIEGCKPQFKIGSCCPSRYNCTDEAATTVPPGIMQPEDYEGCRYHGALYKNGEQVSSPDKCQQCYCMKHEVVCTVKKCEAPSPSCVPLETPEGECCPEKYDCPSGTEIPDSALVHMVTTEEDLFKPSTTEMPQTKLAATSVTSPVPEDESSESLDTSTFESETMFPTTKGIRRIDLEDDLTTISTLEAEDSTDEISTDIISRSRVPKITESPDDMYTGKVAPKITTRRPTFYVNRTIPGEGGCFYKNHSYQHGEKFVSVDPCDENCTCMNSVVKCDSVECFLNPPQSGAKCKVKKSPEECCPRYVCADPESTPSPKDTATHAQQTIMDVTPEVKQQEIINESSIFTTESDTPSKTGVTDKPDQQTIEFVPTLTTKKVSTASESLETLSTKQPETITSATTEFSSEDKTILSTISVTKTTTGDEIILETATAEKEETTVSEETMTTDMTTSKVSEIMPKNISTAVTEVTHESDISTQSVETIMSSEITTSKSETEIDTEHVAISTSSLTDTSSTTRSDASSVTIESVTLPQIITVTEEKDVLGTTILHETTMEDEVRKTPIDTKSVTLTEGIFEETSTQSAKTFDQTMSTLSAGTVTVELGIKESESTSASVNETLDSKSTIEVDSFTSGKETSTQTTIIEKVEYDEVTEKTEPETMTITDSKSTDSSLTVTIASTEKGDVSTIVPKEMETSVTAIKTETDEDGLLKSTTLETEFADTTLLRRGTTVDIPHTSTVLTTTLKTVESETAVIKTETEEKIISTLKAETTDELSTKLKWTTAELSTVTSSVHPETYETTDIFKLTDDEKFETIKIDSTDSESSTVSLIKLTTDDIITATHTDTSEELESQTTVELDVGISSEIDKTTFTQTPKIFTPESVETLQTTTTESRKETAAILTTPQSIVSETEASVDTKEDTAITDTGKMDISKDMMPTDASTTVKTETSDTFDTSTLMSQELTHTHFTKSEEEKLGDKSTKSEFVTFSETPSSFIEVTEPSRTIHDEIGLDMSTLKKDTVTKLPTTVSDTKDIITTVGVISQTGDKTEEQVFETSLSTQTSTLSQVDMSTTSSQTDGKQTDIKAINATESTVVTSETETSIVSIDTQKSSESTDVVETSVTETGKITDVTQVFTTTLKSTESDSEITMNTLTTTHKDQETTSKPEITTIKSTESFDIISTSHELEMDSTKPSILSTGTDKLSTKPSTLEFSQTETEKTQSISLSVESITPEISTIPEIKETETPSTQTTSTTLHSYDTSTDDTKISSVKESTKLDTEMSTTSVTTETLIINAASTMLAESTKVTDAKIETIMSTDTTKYVADTVSAKTTISDLPVVTTTPEPKDTSSEKMTGTMLEKSKTPSIESGITTDDIERDMEEFVTKDITTRSDLLKSTEDKFSESPTTIVKHQEEDSTTISAFKPITEITEEASSTEIFTEIFTDKIPVKLIPDSLIRDKTVTRSPEIETSTSALTSKADEIETTTTVQHAETSETEKTDISTVFTTGNYSETSIPEEVTRVTEDKVVKVKTSSEFPERYSTDASIITTLGVQSSSISEETITKISTTDISEPSFTTVESTTAEDIQFSEEFGLSTKLLDTDTTKSSVTPTLLHDKTSISFEETPESILTTELSETVSFEDKTKSPIPKFTSDVTLDEDITKIEKIDSILNATQTKWPLSSTIATDEPTTESIIDGITSDQQEAESTTILSTTLKQEIDKTGSLDSTIKQDVSTPKFTPEEISTFSVFTSHDDQSALDTSTQVMKTDMGIEQNNMTLELLGSTTESTDHIPTHTDATKLSEIEASTLLLAETLSPLSSDTQDLETPTEVTTVTEPKVSLKTTEKAFTDNITETTLLHTITITTSEVDGILDGSKSSVEILPTTELKETTTLTDSSHLLISTTEEETLTSSTADEIETASPTDEQMDIKSETTKLSISEQTLKAETSTESFTDSFFPKDQKPTVTETNQLSEGTEKDSSVFTESITTADSKSIKSQTVTEIPDETRIDDLETTSSITISTKAADAEIPVSLFTKLDTVTSDKSTERDAILSTLPVSESGKTTTVKISDDAVSTVPTTAHSQKSFTNDTPMIIDTEISTLELTTAADKLSTYVDSFKLQPTELDTDLTQQSHVFTEETELSSTHTGMTFISTELPHITASTFSEGDRNISTDSLSPTDKEVEIRTTSSFVAEISTDDSTDIKTVFFTEKDSSTSPDKLLVTQFSTSPETLIETESETSLSSSTLPGKIKFTTQTSPKFGDETEITIDTTNASQIEEASSFMDKEISTPTFTSIGTSEEIVIMTTTLSSTLDAELETKLKTASTPEILQTLPSTEPTHKITENETSLSTSEPDISGTTVGVTEKHITVSSIKEGLITEQDTTETSDQIFTTLDDFKKTTTDKDQVTVSSSESVSTSKITSETLEEGHTVTMDAEETSQIVDERERTDTPGSTVESIDSISSTISISTPEEGLQQETDITEDLSIFDTEEAISISDSATKLEVKTESTFISTKSDDVSSTTESIQLFDSTGKEAVRTHTPEEVITETKASKITGFPTAATVSTATAETNISVGTKVDIEITLTTEPELLDATTKERDVIMDITTIQTEEPVELSTSIVTEAVDTSTKTESSVPTIDVELSTHLPKDSISDITTHKDIEIHFTPTEKDTDVAISSTLSSKVTERVFTEKTDKFDTSEIATIDFKTTKETSASESQTTESFMHFENETQSGTETSVVFTTTEEKDIVTDRVTQTLDIKETTTHITMETPKISSSTAKEETVMITSKTSQITDSEVTAPKATKIPAFDKTTEMSTVKEFLETKEDDIISSTEKESLEGEMSTKASELEGKTKLITDILDSDTTTIDTVSTQQIFTKSPEFSSTFIESTDLVTDKIDDVSKEITTTVEIQKDLTTEKISESSDSTIKDSEIEKTQETMSDVTKRVTTTGEFTDKIKISSDIFDETKPEITTVAYTTEEKYMTTEITERETISSSTEDSSETIIKKFAETTTTQPSSIETVKAETEKSTTSRTFTEEPTFISTEKEMVSVKDSTIVISTTDVGVSDISSATDLLTKDLKSTEFSTTEQSTKLSSELDRITKLELTEVSESTSITPITDSFAEIEKITTLKTDETTTVSKSVTSVTTKFSAENITEHDTTFDLDTSTESSEELDTLEETKTAKPEMDIETSVTSHEILTTLPDISTMESMTIIPRKTTIIDTGTSIPKTTPDIAILGEDESLIKATDFDSSIKTESHTKLSDFSTTQIITTKFVPTTEKSSELPKTFSTGLDSTTAIISEKESELTPKSEISSEITAEHTFVTEETIVSNKTFAPDALVLITFPTYVPTDDGITSTIDHHSITEMTSTSSSLTTMQFETSDSEISQDISPKDMISTSVKLDTTSSATQTLKGDEVLNQTTSETTTIKAFITTEPIEMSQESETTEIQDGTSLSTLTKISTQFTDEIQITTTESIEKSVDVTTSRPIDTKLPVTDSDLFETSKTIEDAPILKSKDTTVDTAETEVTVSKTTEKTSIASTTEDIKTVTPEISRKEADAESTTSLSSTEDFETSTLIVKTTTVEKEDKTPLTVADTSKLDTFAPEKITLASEIDPALTTKSDVIITTEKWNETTSQDSLISQTTQDKKLFTLLPGEASTTAQTSEASVSTSDSEMTEEIVTRHDEIPDSIITKTTTHLGTESQDILSTSSFMDKSETSIPLLVTATDKSDSEGKDKIHTVFEDITTKMEIVSTERPTETDISEIITKQIDFTTDFITLSKDTEETSIPSQTIAPVSETDSTEAAITMKSTDKLATTQLFGDLLTETEKAMTIKLSENISTSVTLSVETEAPIDLQTSSSKDIEMGFTTASVATTKVVIPTTEKMLVLHSTEMDVKLPSTLVPSSHETGIEDVKFDSTSTVETLDQETSSEMASSETSSVTESTSSTATTVPSETVTEIGTSQLSLTTDSIRKEDAASDDNITTDDKIFTEPTTLEKTDDCFVNGTFYKDAQAITTIDPCEKCHCSSGEIVCFKILCKLPKDGCKPTTKLASECCPSSYECAEDEIETTAGRREFTVKDVTTPIPISFMFSTMPSSIASTMLITKQDTSEEITKATTDIVTDKELKTVSDKDILLTSSDILITDKTAKDGVSSVDTTLDMVETQHPGTEVTRLAPNISTSSDLDSISTTGFTTMDIKPDPTRLEIEDKTSVTKDMLTSVDHDFVSTSEETKDVASSEKTIFTSLSSEQDTTLEIKETSTVKEYISTTSKDEIMSEITMQATERPSTLRTVETTLDVIHKDRDGETSLSQESTTGASVKTSVKELQSTISSDADFTTVLDTEKTKAVPSTESTGIAITTDFTPISSTDIDETKTFASTDTTDFVKVKEFISTASTVVQKTKEFDSTETTDIKKTTEFTSTTSSYIEKAKDVTSTATTDIETTKELSSTVASGTAVKKEDFTSIASTDIEETTEFASSETTDFEKTKDFSSTETTDVEKAKEFISFVTTGTEIQKDSTSAASTDIEETTEFPTTKVIDFEKTKDFTSTETTDVDKTKEFISFTTTGTEIGKDFTLTETTDVEKAKEFTSFATTGTEIRKDFTSVASTDIEVTTEFPSTEAIDFEKTKDFTSTETTDVDKAKEFTSFATTGTEIQKDFTLTETTDVEKAKEFTSFATTGTEIRKDSTSVASTDIQETTEFPPTKAIDFEETKDFASTEIADGEQAKEFTSFATTGTEIQKDFTLTETTDVEKAKEFTSFATTGTEIRKDSTSVASTDIEETTEFPSTKAIDFEKTKDFTSTETTDVGKAKEFTSFATTGTEIQKDFTLTETTDVEKAKEFTSFATTGTEIRKESTSVASTDIQETTEFSSTKAIDFEETKDFASTEIADVEQAKDFTSFATTGTEIRKDSTLITSEDIEKTIEFTSTETTDIKKVKEFTTIASTDIEKTKEITSTATTDIGKTKEFTLSVTPDIEQPKLSTETTITDVERTKEFISTKSTDIDVTKDFTAIMSTDIEKTKEFTSTATTDIEKKVTSTTAMDIKAMESTSQETIQKEDASSTIDTIIKDDITKIWGKDDSTQTTKTEDITEQQITTLIPSKLPKLDDATTVAIEISPQTSIITFKATDEVTVLAETTKQEFSTKEIILPESTTTRTKSEDKEIITTDVPMRTTILTDTSTSSILSFSDSDAETSSRKEEFITDKTFNETTEETGLLTTLSSLPTLPSKSTSMDIITTLGKTIITETSKSLLTTSTFKAEDETRSTEHVLGGGESTKSDMDMYVPTINLELSTISSMSNISSETDVTTDYEIVTEILEPNKTITILDRKGTQEKESGASTISTLEDILVDTSTLVTTESRHEENETTLFTGVTDKIFTFVSTRFTDLMKGITELTTEKPDNETVSALMDDTTTVSTLRFSTEKTDETITPLISLTRRIDMDIETSTAEESSEKAETTQSTVSESSTQKLVTKLLVEDISTPQFESETSNKTTDDKTTSDHILTTIASIMTSSKPETILLTTESEKDTISTAEPAEKELEISLPDRTEKEILTSKSTQIPEDSHSTDIFSTSLLITSSVEEREKTKTASETTVSETKVSTLSPDTISDIKDDISSTQEETSKTIQESGTDATIQHSTMTSTIQDGKTFSDTSYSETDTVTTKSPLPTSEAKALSEITEFMSESESSVTTEATERRKEITISDTDKPSRATRKDMGLETTPASFTKVDMGSTVEEIKEKSTQSISDVSSEINVTISTVIHEDTTMSLESESTTKHTELSSLSLDIDNVTDKHSTMVKSENDTLTTFEAHTVSPTSFETTTKLIKDIPVITTLSSEKTAADEGEQETTITTRVESITDVIHDTTTSSDHKEASATEEISKTTSDSTRFIIVTEKELPTSRTVIIGSETESEDLGTQKITSESIDTTVVPHAETMTTSSTEKSTDSVTNDTLPSTMPETERETTFKDMRTQKTTPKPVSTTIVQLAETTIALSSDKSTVSVATGVSTTTILSTEKETMVETQKTTSEPIEITVVPHAETITTSSTDISTDSVTNDTLSSTMTGTERGTTFEDMRTQKTTPKPVSTTIVQLAETTTAFSTEKSTVPVATDTPSSPTHVTSEEAKDNATEIITKGFKAIETSPTPYTTTAHPSIRDSETTTTEEDYLVEENTCIFQGRLFQSAEQIPREDPCEFCFCFRSDIICLQQSCPPPAPDCNETRLAGFCCPRYECPVYLTSKNLTLFNRRKGSQVYIQQRRIDKRAIRPTFEVKGCQVNGTFYELGKTVTSASGPCLHCVCQEDGLMHCDPQRCKPQAPLMLKMNNSFFRRR